MPLQRNEQGRVVAACRNTLMLDFWLAASDKEWRRTTEIIRRAGRAGKGDSTYAGIIRALVTSGHLESTTQGTKGRSVTLYRRNTQMFYPHVKDKRFDFLPWNRLPEAVKVQAQERYADAYPWLDKTDWLYPLTQKLPHLASGASRILAISEDDAEAKREQWRTRQAAWFTGEGFTGGGQDAS